MAGKNNTYYVKQKKTDGGGKVTWEFLGTIVLRPNGNGVLFFGPKDAEGKQPEYALFAKREKGASGEAAAQA